MPIELAPYDLALQDWGRPAFLRKAADLCSSTPEIDHPVTVIPQTIRLTQTDTIAAVHGASRSFLIQATALPESLQWMDCELFVDHCRLRVIAAEDSGTGGWTLLETRSLQPHPAT